MAPWDTIRERVGQFRSYVKITEADEIARRYFVMNAFDGSLTMLGIILGTALAQVQDARIIIGAGVGASLAMGMSGFFGTYMTERAERTRKLKKLERAMVTNLDDSVWDNASSFVSVWAAFVDGLSQALAAIVAVVPFILAHFRVLDFSTALYSSLVLIALTLFVLGAYLGRISEENLVWNGLRMLVVGAVTGFLVWLISIGGEGQTLALAAGLL
jgi:predicted membrane protein (TIGR00267 family)